tara:strand:+ start:526 stop:999 length:474 start_codon:yes stop_codon:yes gene_type:complete
MPQLKMTDLSKVITEAVKKSVSKMLLSRVRKIVREEIDRGMRQVMVEVIKSQNQPMTEQPQSFLSNTDQAKTSIVQRQQKARERARAIVEKKGGPVDPLMDMVINAEDLNEEKQIQEQRQLSQPMVNSNDVVPGGDAAGLDPLNIDFSDRLERLGIE